MKLFLPLSFLLICAPVWAQNPVTIQVVDAQGGPVAATVEARVLQGEEWSSVTGMADAAGVVTLDLPVTATETSPVLGLVVAKGYAFSKLMLKGAREKITLQKGETWRGAVIDEAGQPVAGAKVTVIGVNPTEDWKSVTYLFSFKLAPTYIVQTGADGSFAVSDVPPKGLIARIEAPKFAGQHAQDVVADVPARYSLVRGAAVTGRLLGIDGKPLPKVHLFAQPIGRGMGYGTAETGEDGTFVIDTLEPGSYNVMFDRPENAEYAVPAQQNVHVAKGETLALPDTRAAVGVVVTGVVRSAKDGKPVAGARVGVYGPVRPPTTAAVTGSTLTGADGKFEVRCLPGSNRFYITQTPGNYRRTQMQMNLTIGTAPPAPLVFKLNPVISRLQGQLVNEAGQPIAASVRVDYKTTIQSGPDGKWQFEPIEVETEDGPVEIGGGDGEDGYYEVVSPRTLDLTEAAPVIITLRKKSWQVLPGQAKTPDGKPLEGVEVTAIYLSTNGDGRSGAFSSQRTAMSNANGDFTIPQVRANVDAQSFRIQGSKAGYVFQSGGAVSKNGPVLQISDLIFAPLNRKIAGTTAPGARVVADGQEVQADGDGKFHFEGLAERNSPVFATQADTFGGGPVKEPFVIELNKLGLQGNDPALAHEMWTEVSRDSAGKSYYMGRWVEAQMLAGEDRETQLAKASAQGDGAIMALGTAWDWQGDTALLTKAISLLKNPNARLSAAQTAARRTGDAQLAKLALDEAKAIIAAPEGQVSSRELAHYSIVPIAARFEGEEAGLAALDRAVAYTIKNHGSKARWGDDGRGNTMSRDEVLVMQARMVAAGSVPLMQRLLSYIEAEPSAGYQTQAYSNSIPVVAKAFGYEAALPLFDELEQLPETVPDEGAAGERGGRLSKDASFAIAARYVVPMMEKSPAEALKLARRVREPWARPQVLAMAARFQTGDEATKLWLEVANEANQREAAQYASLAWESDHALGEKLFAIARQKSEMQRSVNAMRNRELANFAFYYARVNPAEARFLLEKAWGASPLKIEYDGSDELAVAMSAIDARRAWEMARLASNGRNNESFEARRKIGHYLTMSPEKRLTWSFSDWRAMGTLPGEVD
jgi:hypothetical protein